MIHAVAILPGAIDVARMVPFHWPASAPLMTRAAAPCREKPVDDLRLIRGSLRGRREDFGALVDRYQKPLYAFVCRQLGDGEAADDVVQTTFLRAFSALRTFRGDASFSTWLHQIALNECRTRHRQKARLREVALDDAGEAMVAPEENRGAGVELAGLRRWIEKLPPKQKSVLNLRVFSDLPFKDIARIEQISENSAKVNYHHAVKKLREWMT